MTVHERHAQVIKLRSDGKNYKQIAEITGYTQGRISDILNGSRPLRTSPVDWNSYNPGVMSVDDTTRKIVQRLGEKFFEYQFYNEAGELMLAKHAKVRELHSQGMRPAKIAKAVGYTREYVWKLIQDI